MKQNLTSENETKSGVRFSTLHNVDTKLVPDLTSVSKVETLVKVISNPIRLAMIMDFKQMNCFFSTKLGNIFYYILTIQLRTDVQWIRN